MSLPTKHCRPIRRRLRTIRPPAITSPQKPKTLKAESLEQQRLCPTEALKTIGIRHQRLIRDIFLRSIFASTFAFLSAHAQRRLRFITFNVYTSYSTSITRPQRRDHCFTRLLHLHRSVVH